MQSDRQKKRQRASSKIVKKRRQPSQRSQFMQADPYAFTDISADNRELEAGRDGNSDEQSPGILSDIDAETHDVADRPGHASRHPRATALNSTDVTDPCLNDDAVAAMSSNLEHIEWLQDAFSEETESHLPNGPDRNAAHWPFVEHESLSREADLRELPTTNVEPTRLVATTAWQRLARDSLTLLNSVMSFQKRKVPLGRISSY